nr:MAG TPA: hypothetical protein [Caudoviricetes sp.]
MSSYIISSRHFDFLSHLFVTSIISQISTFAKRKIVYTILLKRGHPEPHTSHVYFTI